MESEEEVPFGGFALLMGAFTVAFGGMLVAASRRRVLPERIAPRDIALLGIATHKVTRIITRDKVTSVIRHPFTRKIEDSGAGEVEEKPRGHGLRRAIGSLLTCAFCTGPWVAAAFTAGLLTRPRATRVVASVFTIVAISDFTHQAYAFARRA